MGDAPSQELEQIQRGFIGPVDIFNHHDGGKRALPELIQQSGEQRSSLCVATHERRQAAFSLSGNIVERSQRARGKERFAGPPQLPCCPAMLVHKLLHQRRFADASLPADEYSPPMAGCGRTKEYRQLLETVVTFEKVHTASSALSKDFRTKIPRKSMPGKDRYCYEITHTFAPRGLWLLSLSPVDALCQHQL